VIGFTALLELTRTVFSAPSFAIFSELMSGWVLAPGRRTITSIISVADPLGRRAHDAYHRFVRDGKWVMAGLWRVVATHAVTRFAAVGVISIDCDDTLMHKSGRHVNGAGVFRDAVRSGGGRTIYAFGLNIVVITLRVNPPWGGCPIGLPINARLHRKNDTTTTIAHAEAMIRELAEWFPDRHFHLCADGAYASLADSNLPRCQLTSRMRRDAALFEPAPPRTGRRGRPRTRGPRLPTPPAIAAQTRPRQWQRVTVDIRGQRIERLIHTRLVLWYRVNHHHPVLLVIVRDPTDNEDDNYLFTTDHTATGTDTTSRYAGRWSIEITFRDTKQDLHAEDPQSWKRQAPARAAALALWLHTATWSWYLDTHPTGGTWLTRPWYRHKTTPSFLDALAALRRTLWTPRITALSSPTTDHNKITQTLLDTLAYAA
jgi:hypothetical protein